VVAWTGMRGLVSLAAALSLPLTVAGGRPFPDRDLIIYLTFCVILATLVLQGLSLPLLMRRLGVGDDPSIREAEELAARSHAIDTALAQLDAIAAEERVWDEAIRYLRARYGKRRHTLDARFGRLDHEHRAGDGLRHQHETGADHALDHRDRLAALVRLQRELLAVERAAVVRLRNVGQIGDEVLQRIQRDLDLEELSLGAE